MRDTTSTRRDVVRTLAATTEILLVLLLVGARILTALPERQADLVRAALAAGDPDRAEQLTERFLSGEQRAELLRAVDYTRGKELFDRGEWEAARQIFASLADYEDSPEMARRCVVALGDEALARGEFDASIALYESVPDYELADRARYLQAEQAEERGAPDRALELYLALGEYPGARERACALAMSITGETDPERAILLAGNMSPEDLQRLDAVRRRRESLPSGVLDVGFFHTVGLCSDGTAVAVGDNSFGQCDVSGWRDITAVAAGAYHTVGLRADGTVVAAGRNSEGQCGVSGWSGVVQIAAADYATFALLSDGTVVYAGFNDCPDVESWTGVQYITGGSYAAGALRSGGAALISHITARSDTLRELVGLTVNTGFAVGLRADGTLVSPQVPLPDWKDAVALSSSGTAVLVLRADGTVAARFFRPEDDPGVAEERNVIAAAAGGTHFAFLHDDGTVTVLGQNAHGEADTADWRLAVGA